MSRFSHYDTDEERLPEGMTRVGYDADEQVYTYQDADGCYWQGPPGARYGLLTRISDIPTSTASPDAEPFLPSTGNLEPWEEERKSWRQGYHPLLNFFVLAGLFILFVFWYLERMTAPEKVDCGENAIPYKITTGDTCWAIAERHKMSVEDLLKANLGLDCDRLQLGKSICLPSAKHIDQ